MDIPLKAEVYCSDGACGHSTAIIVDPATQRVTHFVVQTAEDEFLLPISAIVASTPTRITLGWSLAELSHAEPFLQEAPASEEQLDVMAASMTRASVLGPYTAPDASAIADSLASATVMEEQVPENELAIHQDARVEATDGDVGKVDEFVIDPETNMISHLVLRQGRLWTKRDVSVPVDAIERVEGDMVYLKLDKKAIEQLPAAPAPKK